MPRPIIALVTDFGLRDHYVGVMKGVALGICPEAALVDITHEIAPQDVLGGALQLAASYRYFPPGTVFLVVVDPGVGSGRRAIAAQAGGWLFVAPDNGVLAPALEQESGGRVVELKEERYARLPISRTFEGRDRFAPAAGWLAAGVPIDALGPAVERCVPLEVPRPVTREASLDGEVLRSDRFGNLITNIDRPAFDRFLAGRAARIEAGGPVAVPFVNTYADVSLGMLCALFGSGGSLELSVNGGSAAALLSAGRGLLVRVRRAVSGQD